MTQVSEVVRGGQFRPTNTKKRIGPKSISELGAVGQDMAWDIASSQASELLLLNFITGRDYTPRYFPALKEEDLIDLINFLYA